MHLKSKSMSIWPLQNLVTEKIAAMGDWNNMLPKTMISLVHYLLYATVQTVLLGNDLWEFYTWDFLIYTIK